MKKIAALSVVLLSALGVTAVSAATVPSTGASTPSFEVAKKKHAAAKPAKPKKAKRA